LEPEITGSNPNLKADVFVTWFAFLLRCPKKNKGRICLPPPKKNIKKCFITTKTLAGNTILDCRLSVMVSLGPKKVKMNANKDRKCKTG
jgi:hypothetical protein